MADDPDVALSVALAEYEHLRESRIANTGQSTARFNFFLVVTSAATAVAGGLLTGGGSGRITTTAVIGIGALVLLLGLTVFVRQVEFVNRARLYAVAIDSVRTYLARRAPEVAPYLILPTLDDAGVYQGRPPGGRWLRDAIGLAGTVGLVNSAVLALAGWAGARYLGAAPWLASSVGVVVLLGITGAHVGYVRHRTSTAFDRIRAAVDQRHLPGDTTLGAGPGGGNGPAAGPSLTVDPAGGPAPTVEPTAVPVPVAEPSARVRWAP